MKRPSAALAAAVFSITAFSGCGGGGGSSSGPSVNPPIAQSPAPAQPPSSQSATCPASGPAISSVGTNTSTLSFVRRGPAVDDGSNQFVPGAITVTYSSQSSERGIDNAANAMQGHASSALRFDAVGVRARVVSVDPARVNEAIARLRTTPGVLSVERVQYRHIESAVNVTDPYYRGFGPGAPFFENASTPGQWDMHLIDVGDAWGDFSTLPAKGAAVAIIDTGVDVSHPEFEGNKIIRQRCFVTFPSSASQTTSGFAVDTDGHGTNVAGIADADTNNSFGFAGVAFDAPMLAYRIFPTTPAGGCIGSTKPQCSTTDVDEASAINDAVSHGAKVINLSIGATGPLSNCNDSVERNAVESAISHHVVVVAAAGNESKNVLDCPAAYPGVIAVGADGVSGSSNTDIVASYSNWSSASGGGSGGAFLVAPGGAATSSTDNDDLHFVENITSSEAADSSSFCTRDFAGATGDCRAGFAGTSQATPHVSGVVSLMLGLRPSLSPAQIASDLCSTAHSIGSSKQGCGRVNAAAAVQKALSQ